MRDVSPREAWLERAYERASSELEYYRRLHEGDLPRYSILRDPELKKMVMPQTHMLPLVSESRMSASVHDGGLHVSTYFRSEDGKNHQLCYFMDSMSMDTLSDSQRADIMVRQHDKLVFDLGRMLWA